jgi:MFS family permease
MATAADSSSILHGFRALRVRNYRRYWFGQMVSQIGSWMQVTAQGWLVLNLTDSPLAVGLVTTFQFVPVMLLALVGGAISDWLPRHRLIIATQWAALGQALVFGVLVASGHIRLEHVYALAALQGVIQALDTPARQAFVSDLVGREDVVSAVALNSMLFNTARMVGPALAGVLLAHLGVDTLLFANAASFGAVLLALHTLDAPALFRKQGGPRPSVRQGLTEGLRYALATPEVRALLAVVATLGVFGYNWSATMPLLGGFVLQTDAAGLGMLWTFLGMGSLVGASLAAVSGQVSPRRMALSAVGFGVLLVGLAFCRTMVSAAVLLMGLGALGILFSTASNSLLQLQVPEALRGRVMSVHYLLFMGTTPVGAFLLGAGSDVFGVPVALGLCGVLCLAGVGASLLLGRPRADGVPLAGG